MINCGLLSDLKRLGEEETLLNVVLLRWIAVDVLDSTVATVGAAVLFKCLFNYYKSLGVFDKFLKVSTGETPCFQGLVLFCITFQSKTLHVLMVFGLIPKDVFCEQFQLNNDEQKIKLN